jgi:hypothetical protein
MQAEPLVDLLLVETPSSSMVRGVLFVLLVLLSSFLGVVFFHAFLVFVLFVRPSWHRWAVDVVIGSWLLFCAVGPSISTAYACSDASIIRSCFLLLCTFYECV